MSVDVLEVMGAAIGARCGCGHNGGDCSINHERQRMTEARAAVAELIEAANAAADVLAKTYAKYGTKIGPFASQSQAANVRLRAALKAVSP